MTLSILIDGVEVAGTTELEGLQSVSARADGSYTDSGLAIDDPAGSEEFLQLSQVVIEEDDCAQPRAFTGWVHRSSIGRGPYRDGAARVHTLEVADLNFLLHLRVLHEADAARPAETFDARMTWLLASVALDGLVWDDGLVASSSSGFDEADYRGRYADDVLAEIAGPLGRIFFVRWDPTAGHPSLFCDVPSAAVHSSTLKISNVLSDVDGSTTFAPTPDSEVTGAGEDIYDGVRFKAVGIDIYRQNPTTFATFGIHRDASYETTRIGRIATAETYAAAFLVNHSGQVDTITCTIRLPSDKLTLIEAGMRMQVRFSHLPGYETDTWVRVTGLTFTFTPGRNDFYEVQLELSNRGLSAVPSGGTDVFPQQPCAEGTGSLVQQSPWNHWLSTDPTTVDLPAAPTVGNMLVAFLVFRDDTETATVDGFTQIGNEVEDQDDQKASLWYRPVEEGDTATISFTIVGVGNAPKGIAVAEFLGPLEFVTYDELETLGDQTGPANFSIDCGEVSPQAGSRYLAVGAGIIGINPSDPFTPAPNDPAITELSQSPGGAPGAWWGFQRGIAPALSGVAIGAIYFSPSAVGHGTGGITALFQCSGESNQPPGPGVYVRREIVGVGDGTTTTFTTRWPYADGSLRVSVDGVEIVNGLIESDPTTGEFVLDFAPHGQIGDSPPEVIRATYQGR